MKHKESGYPKDWMRIEKELKRAQNLLGLGDPEGAGFNLQQALEKYFKAYLLSRGWKLRRIHDLETLLNEVVVYDASFEEYRPACQKITQYYIEERYPMTASSELTEQEVNESLVIAERVVEKIKHAVQG
ncbi:MAG: HEPN domain-containing protein [Nitrospirota bacterium]